jgi:alpha 1,2-mannosyltransferase
MLGFNIAYTEHMESVPSLWDTVLAFQRDHPKLTNSLPKDNLIRFVTNDNGKTYNTCHFWSNFEIGDLSLWRSKEYLSLFDYLDKSGGFYYER